jgi:ABC-type multidrug transport system fused ATPase/permease subunit
VSQDLALEEEFARVPLRRKTLSRVMRYLRPHARTMAFALTIEFLWVVSVSIDPWLIQQALDGPLPRGDVAGSAVYVLWLVGSVVARAAVTVWELRAANRVGIEVLRAIRQDVFDHVQRQSMRYFDRTKQGRIIARADRDVDSLEHLITWGPVVLVSLTASMAVGFARLCVSQAYLAPWILATIPLLWIVMRVFDRYGFPAYRRVRETHSAISSHVAESVTGVRVIKAFAAEDRERERLERRQTDYRAAVSWGARIAGGFVPSLTLAIQALLVAALVLGASRVVDGDLTVGRLVEAMMLLSMVLGPVEGLGSLYNESLVAGAAAERIFLLLDTVPEVRDEPGASDPGRLSGEVEFDGVGFSYDPTGGGERQIADVSFRVEPGETLALVGHTGAGKTTILNLLARFYWPQEGVIRFDGRDAKTIAGAALHRQMGIVLQENFLFAGSVLENLRFVRPDLTAAEARDGFAALGVLEVLDGFAAGIETVVGERGAIISVGERQIVCFVRAWLSKPSILILDEATSAVDTRTEALLLRAMRALSTGQTTFVIAHRLSTIRDADRILVFDHGRLVEEGRHEDLLARDGVYARLYAEYAK